MSYIDLGYNSLLTKEYGEDDELTITEENADEIVEDGAVSWDKVDPGGNTPESGATNNSAEIVNGVLISDVVNSQFDTSTQKILGDFTFGASGAISMNTDADNGVWLSSGGMLGKTAGVTTFAIDTDGNASFRGNVVITGGSGIASLTDAGSLATADTVGASDCDSTIISGGKIITGLLTADNIQAGTLTGRTVQTASSGQRVVISSDNSVYFYNSGGTQLGRLWADTGTTLLESLNASYYLTLKAPSTATYGILLLNGTTTISQINSNGVIIHNNLPIYPNGAYGGSVGTSSKPWSTMYATTYYFDRSGYSEKYIQMASDGSAIETNHDFYVGGNISATGKLNLTASATNPASAGDIRNYASGATDQFRGIPGDGSWAGSFDMTAY